MFAKLALKNIKRSIKDYAIYFFTLVLGVAIFYVFNALDSQTVMMDVTERVRDILELISVLLGVVSVFVSFILGALIIYASRFLIKRRSKEFGLYLVLGMGKRKISLILLLETFFIGLLSLGVGLLLGVIASQFMSVLVANMFEANMTNFQFVFSLSACFKTLTYFGIIYLFVMVFNTINISRQKLINLLSSSKRNEVVKMKNPWLCTIVFLISCIMLGIAYYLVTAGLNKFMEDASGVQKLLIPIVMGVAATFTLFWSLSGILLKIFMSFKNTYYNKLNSFILRQFSSKINTTVASMSLICLMLFVTICVLGSALSINSTLHAAIERSLPFDAQVEGYGSSKPNIEEAYWQDNVDINNILKDIVTYRRFALESYSMSDSLGNVSATLDENGVVQSSRTTEYFVKQSDYNKVAPAFSLPALDLAQDEYAVVANYPEIVKLRNKALAADTPIEVEGQVLRPKLDHCIEGTLELEAMAMNGGVIIVPDSFQIKTTHVYYRETLLGNYVNTERSAELEQQLMSLNNRFFNSETGEEGAIYNPGIETNSPVYYYNVETRQSIIDNNVGTSAMVTFIGLYLGIIFLISSAAVLALKELSESSDNRAKYAILRKIGASNKLLNAALFWQIFIFFLFPLLIAILHSIFGLKFCSYILSSIGGTDITGSLPWVTLILGAIYGGYFVITYLCSRNIIREHRS